MLLVSYPPNHKFDSPEGLKIIFKAKSNNYNVKLEIQQLAVATALC